MSKYLQPVVCPSCGSLDVASLSPVDKGSALCRVCNYKSSVEYFLPRAAVLSALRERDHARAEVTRLTEIKDRAIDDMVTKAQHRDHWMAEAKHLRAVLQAIYNDRDFRVRVNDVTVERARQALKETP